MCLADIQTEQISHAFQGKPGWQLKPALALRNQQHLPKGALTYERAIKPTPTLEKFAVLALLGVILVAAPFILYINESSKVINTTEQEIQGLAPMRL